MNNKKFKYIFYYFNTTNIPENRHEKLLSIYSKVNYFHIHRVDIRFLCSWIHLYFSYFHNLCSSDRPGRCFCPGACRRYNSRWRIRSNQYLESLHQCYRLCRSDIFAFYQRRTHL